MCKNVCIGAACLMLLGVTSVFATPTANGTIEISDGYTDFIEDINGETEPVDGFDIDKLYFANDATTLYVGLTVESGVLDANGLDGSYGSTTFFLKQYDNGVFNRMLQVGLNDTGAIYAMMFNEFGVPISLVGTTVGVGNSLELALDLNYWGTIPTNVSYSALLDNGGVPYDDEITGAMNPTPEPATMSLLAIGGISMLVRKRRRKA